MTPTGYALAVPAKLATKLKRSGLARDTHIFCYEGGLKTIMVSPKTTLCGL